MERVRDDMVIRNIGPSNGKWLLVLILILPISACSLDNDRTSVVDSQPSTQLSVSQTPSPRSTASPFPTLTPTVTRAHPQISTLTPGTPSNLNVSSYTLQNWTEREALELISHVETYISSKENYYSDLGIYGWAGYMQEFEVLSYALDEALLRFPDSPQAMYWQFERCYYLAFSDAYGQDQQAKELDCYGDLIVNALNTEVVDIENLPVWFAAYEERLVINIVNLEPPPGYKLSKLLELESADEEAIILLLQSPGGYEFYGIFSNLFYYRGAWVETIFEDITGDGYAELIFRYGGNSCCGFFNYINIYDLHQVPPHRLAIFDDDGLYEWIGALDSGEYHPLDDDANFPGFIFESRPDTYGDPCTLSTLKTFHWTGTYFELVNTKHEIQSPGKYDDQELCTYVIDTISDPIEMEVVVDVLSNVYLDKMPLDVIRDELRYRLGEFYARIGKWEKAKVYLEDLLSHTYYLPDNPYLSPAELLLAEYESIDDYYNICSQIEICDRIIAINDLTSTIPIEAFPRLSEILHDWSVPIISHGYFDFDYDNYLEQWFVIQDPNTRKFEFWIFTKAPQNIQSIRVSNINTRYPDIELTSDYQSMNVTQLDEGTRFVFDWSPGIQEAFVYHLHDGTVEEGDVAFEFFEETLNSSYADLIQGSEPTLVLEALQSINDLIDEDKSHRISYARYYYVLGLVSELLQEEESAIEYYLQLWKNFPDSTYAVMARLKLREIP
jgi:hypothetical protein